MWTCLFAWYNIKGCVQHRNIFCRCCTMRACHLFWLPCICGCIAEPIFTVTTIEVPDDFTTSTHYGVFDFRQVRLPLNAKYIPPTHKNTCKLSYQTTSQKLSGSPIHITPVIILATVIPENLVNTSP